MSSSPRSRSRRGLAAVGLLVLTACGSAAAGPPPPLPPSERHPALTIVDRLAAVEPTPDVGGRTGAVALTLLRRADLQGHAIPLSEDDVVTAQHPAAGSPRPTDGQVVVWLGTPPPPPEPQPAPETAPEAEPEPEAEPGPEVPDTQVVAAAPPPAAAAGSGAPSGQVSPAGPTPARASIRTMAPAPFGTVLEGPASWYGPGFEGNTTACGGRYDSSQPTLATRDLRCGTIVHVTGPSGATVQATVTDWGPAEWTNRRFDLSAATFATIAPLGAGVIGVRVTVVGP